MNPNTTPPTDMDPADRALIQSYVEKYVNTGVRPSEKDQVKMLELVKKYNIKINTNPRPIRSRFVKIHKNESVKTKDGIKGIPYVAPRKPLSKGAKKKEAARIRKQENRERHS